MCDLNKGDIVRWNPNQPGYYGILAAIKLSEYGDQPLVIHETRHSKHFCMLQLTSSFGANNGARHWWDVQTVKRDEFMTAVRKRRA